jgi:hypothetical protein
MALLLLTCPGMKWRVVTVALALSAAVHAQTPTTTKGQPVTIRACVKAGIDPGSVVLNRVYEVRGGALIAPAVARPVVYWLDDARKLRSHIGETVEVTGKIQGVGTSEADIQRQPDGSLIVELEGPGNDVETTLDAVPEVVGTSGTRADVETTLIRMHVEQVTRFSERCQ